ncbi:putative F-box/LRR-repeat protein 23 [Lotus japonicus]|uniref:putative F-box/LRR-repeat protein 23 n=1 Tax=Lotus japonicus TaxID=34305 RepID=UPI0025850F27|nr:putative F-box/LRR-repeat protein 23 [Lotus japonicus]
MWRTIDITNHPCYSHSELVNFSRYAIERSCGHLEDISIEDFGTDEVLKYIADSGSHLRQMRLWKCLGITNKGLREAVTKLPMLEEFEISFKHLSKASLEFIGKYCPHLSVLKLNMKEVKSFKFDDQAFAIAKTMPHLRQLQLLGNRLNDKLDYDDYYECDCGCDIDWGNEGVYDEADAFAEYYGLA